MAEQDESRAANDDAGEQAVPVRYREDLSKVAVEAEPKAEAPDDAGSLSMTGFHAGVYLEHLEEVGFLLMLCRDAPGDPELAWQDTAGFEERINAHLDALELGGDLALLCARKLLQGDDEVELLGSALALASVHGGRFMPEVVERLKGAEDLAPHLVTALKRSPQDAVGAAVRPLLEAGEPFVRLAAAQTLSYRLDAAHSVEGLRLTDVDPSVLAAKIELVAAFGSRSHSRELEDRLEDLVGHPDPAVEAATPPDPAVRTAALRALLRMGSTKVVEVARKLAVEGAPETAVPLAICGQAGDLSLLERAAANPGCRLEGLRALGLLGNPGAVETLLEALAGAEDERAIAFAAFRLLTGAPMEVGAAVDPAEIGRWWKENRAAFRTDLRYRHGKPFELQSCLEEMARPSARFESRDLAYLELVARSGHDIPFRADWPVARQVGAIREWAQWWDAEAPRHPGGSYTFAGRAG